MHSHILNLQIRFSNALKIVIHTSFEKHGQHLIEDLVMFVIENFCTLESELIHFSFFNANVRPNCFKLGLS